MTNNTNLDVLFKDQFEKLSNEELGEVTGGSLMSWVRKNQKFLLALGRIETALE